MSIRYKLRNESTPDGDKLLCILRCEDGESDFRTSIPINSDNRHYEEYLEWVAAGNTPEAAD